MHYTFLHLKNFFDEEIKRKEKGKEIRVQSLFYVFEYVLKFLFFYFISLYIDKEKNKKVSVNISILRIFLERGFKPTLGQYVNILRQIYNNSQFIKENFNGLKEILGIIDKEKLVNLRNKHAHFEHKPTEELDKKTASIYIKNLKKIFKILEELFSDYHLGFVLNYRDKLVKIFERGEWLNKKIDLKFKKEDIGVIESLSGDLNSYYLLFLFKKDFSDYVILYPFMFSRKFDDLYSIFFLYKIFKDKGEIKEGLYLSLESEYGIESQRLKVNKGEEGFKIIEILLDRLRYLNTEGYDVEIALRSEYYYIEENEIIMEDKLKIYMPRPEVEGKFEEFVKRKDKGFFIYKGGPGVGKSAIISKLVKKYENCSVHHFISSEKNPVFIWRSILQQVEDKLKKGIKIGRLSLEELKNEFLRSVKDLVSECGRFFFFIDALDELTEEIDKPKIKQLLEDLLVWNLPDNTYICITTRQDVELEVLKTILGEKRLTYEIFEVPNLNFEEVKKLFRDYFEIMDKMDENLLKKIYEHTEGNPLLLKYVRENIKEIKEGKFEKITLENILKEKVNGYLKISDEELRRKRFDFLIYLKIFMEDVKEEDIRELLGYNTIEKAFDFDKEMIYPIYDFLRIYEKEGDRFIGFYHKEMEKAIYEILKKQLTSIEEDIKNCHRKIVEYYLRKLKQ